MTGWTPLYQQIIGSSIWEAKDHIRIAWITLLAVANKEGVAAVTVSGLARLANISLENADDALKVLSAPDTDTLTQLHEGRRIERCEDGWKLLNFQKYREKAKKAALREYNAAKQAEHRANKKLECSTGNTGGFHKPTIEEATLYGAKIGLPGVEIEKYLNFYESKGWKVGKNPMKSWESAMRNWKIGWEERRDTGEHRGDDVPYGTKPINIADCL